MCLGDWEAHGSDRYECSRFEEDPNNTKKPDEDMAIQKDYFYVERFENHAKSLQLEEQTLQRITSKIQDKVMKNKGTWIDWQYLLDATTLLKKCRYTLQYTYPFAYYMNDVTKKQLFENQQSQLEAEVENLSWKVERTEITDRWDLENQMDIAEKIRRTLLKDFLEEIWANLPVFIHIKYMNDDRIFFYSYTQNHDVKNSTIIADVKKSRKVLD